MLISNAYADTAGSSDSLFGNFSSLWPIALMFIVVYFLMIRPQKKKQKEQQDMLSALAPGDEVLTTGGIIGKVLRVADAFLILEVYEGSSIIIQKAAVASMLPKGSIDAMLKDDPEPEESDAEAEDEPEQADDAPESQETDKPEEKKEDAGKPDQTA